MKPPSEGAFNFAPAPQCISWKRNANGMTAKTEKSKGIVSLDGGIGSDFGPYLLEHFPFFNLEKLTMPIMHLYNPHDKGGNLNWFDKTIYNHNYLIGLDHMEHDFFGTFGWMDRHVPYLLGKTHSRVGHNPEIILKASLDFFVKCFNGEFNQSLNLKNYDWINKYILSEDFRFKSAKF